MVNGPACTKVPHLNFTRLVLCSGLTCPSRGITPLLRTRSFPPLPYQGRPYTWYTWRFYMSWETPCPGRGPGIIYNLFYLVEGQLFTTRRHTHRRPPLCDSTQDPSYLYTFILYCCLVPSCAGLPTRQTPSSRFTVESLRVGQNAAQISIVFVDPLLAL